MRSVPARLVPLLLVLAATPALAGVLSGTVIDRTANGPARDVEVLLFRPESPEPIARVVSDAKGRFAFRDIAPGDYFLGASHLGVPYVRRDVRVAAGAPVVTAALEVYQATTDASAVSIEGDHLLVQPEKDGARVIEIVVYNNAGTRTYLGEITPASPTGNRLVVPLPEGYTQLDGQQWLLDRIASHTESGFDLALPLTPGQTQVAFNYHIPGGFLGMNLGRRFPFPVKSVSVLVPASGGWRVRSSHLGRSRTATLQEKRYQVASGGPFPPGSVVSARASKGLLGTGVPPERAAWGAGGVVIAGLSLAWILRRGRPAQSGAAVRTP